MAKIHKPILSRIISPEQTRFVEGKKILDGLVVSQKVVHSLNVKKEEGMMIKLDLSKSYDHLNWNYLKFLRAFGFCNRWIECVYTMISSTNFSILVNGTPSHPFKVSIGLRQRDPLSPFLFIIALEGLGRQIRKEVRERNLKGIQICGNNLPITHHQFVDEIMLFFNVSLKEARRIKEILEFLSKLQARK